MVKSPKSLKRKIQKQKESNTTYIYTITITPNDKNSLNFFKTVVKNLLKKQTGKQREEEKKGIKNKIKVPRVHVQTMCPFNAQ